MNNRKTNKGITLIALIITIIVMLILVTVTITVAVNGGLFEYAKKAKVDTENAIREEQLLAEGTINGQTIDDIVGTAVTDEWYGITEKMEIQEGVTEYHIKSCAELKKFANAVNAGNDFAGKTVYLDKNLDLQGNENKQWAPIGQRIENNSFNGVFNGQNHYISGMYIKEERANYNAGLFGYVEKGSIENVGTINGYIESGNFDAGGVVAYFGEWDNESQYIKNCYNSCTINGDNNTGGIVGNSYGNIEECYNVGKIITNYDGAGGIAGNAAYGVIKKCYNSGEINGVDSTSVGGIIGFSEERELVIENCYNIGLVKGTDCAGGIIGLNVEETKNCYNIGQVEGKNAGKIVGRAYDSTIINCYFLGITN